MEGIPLQGSNYTVYEASAYGKGNTVLKFSYFPTSNINFMLSKMTHKSNNNNGNNSNSDTDDYTNNYSSFSNSIVCIMCSCTF